MKNDAAGASGVAGGVRVGKLRVGIPFVVTVGPPDMEFVISGRQGLTLVHILSSTSAVVYL